MDSAHNKEHHHDDWQHYDGVSECTPKPIITPTQRREHVQTKSRVIVRDHIRYVESCEDIAEINPETEERFRSSPGISELDSRRCNTRPHAAREERHHESKEYIEHGSHGDQQSHARIFEVAMNGTCGHSAPTSVWEPRKNTNISCRQVLSLAPFLFTADITH